MKNRRQMRISVFEAVYQYLFDSEQTVALSEGYEQDTYNGVISQYQYLADCISDCAIQYAKDRIYKVDMSIMLVASFEILLTDIPYSIAINEALELSKIYSTQNSAKFINGVLSQIVVRSQSNMLCETKESKLENGDQANSAVVYDRQS